MFEPHERCRLAPAGSDQGAGKYVACGDYSSERRRDPEAALKFLEEIPRRCLLILEGAPD